MWTSKQHRPARAGGPGILAVLWLMTSSNLVASTAMPAIKRFNSPQDEVRTSRCGRVLCSTPRQELENCTGERCRITTRPIMVDILKHDQLSARDALADRFTN